MHSANTVANAPACPAQITKTKKPRVKLSPEEKKAKKAKAARAKAEKAVKARFKARLAKAAAAFKAKKAKIEEGRAAALEALA